MKNRFILFVLLVLALLISLPSSVSSEDTATQQVTMQISEICLIKVSGTPQNLVITGSETGGLDPVQSSDESTFIQYTSCVGEDLSRTLSVRWGEMDSAPSGCSLKLKAVPAGGENEGVSTGKLTLTSFPQNLITNIGSCATGSGSSQGARLTYDLVVDDPTQLKAGDTSSVTITITLTDVS